MKTFLRWLAVLPGAILAAALVSFPLHFVLYQTLSNFVEPYPELPERILFPLAAAIAFQWAGVKIAPGRKDKTAIILFALWLIFCIAGIWLLLSGTRLGDIDLVAQGGGLGPIFAIVGAFAGLYINWKTQWDTQSDDARDQVASELQTARSNPRVKDELEATLPAGSENTPLISAYAGDMNFMVPFLQAGGPASYSNADGDTLLHAAADGWQHRMIEFLILSGANLNAQNKHGETPLHMVTRRREVPFDGTFLSDTNPEDARKATFRVLLLRGADKRIRDIQAGNPLHIAASEGDLLAIDALALTDPSLIDEVTIKGATALVLAIFGEHVDCVKRLLDLGANPFFELIDGIRPIDLLYSSENPGLRSLFDTISQRREA